jgi:MFS family permease
MGIMGATYALASFVGPLVVGAFTENITWRCCFYLNLPIRGLAAFIIVIFFKSPKAAKPIETPWREKLLQLDPSGCLLIIGAVVSYLMALQWGGWEKKWSESSFIGTLIGFILKFIGFGFSEWWLGECASIVPHFLKRRRILLNCAELCARIAAP